MGIHASIMGVGGNIPPTIATQFQTQNGTGVPSGNKIIINGYDSTENNDNGITTKAGIAAGDPPTPGLVNEVDIYLTNRYSGSVTTTDATQTELVLVPIPLFPAVYCFSGTVLLFDETNVKGSVVNYTFSFRTTAGPGATVQLSSTDQIIQEDAGTAGAILFLSLGVAQTFQILVTGVAATTMKWKATGTFTVVS